MMKPTKIFPSSSCRGRDIPAANKIIFFLLLSLFFVLAGTSCSKQNQVVANYVYENKPFSITRQEMRDEADQRNFSGSQKVPLDMQYNLIKEIFFRKVMLATAKKLQFENENDYVYYKKMRAIENIRSFYRRHWYHQIEKDGYDFISYRHILIKSGEFTSLKKDGNNSSLSHQEAFKKINSIREDILQKKISFAEAAQQFSQDSFSKEQGGLMNYTHPILMDPALSTAVLSLQGKELATIAQVTVDAVVYEDASLAKKTTDQLFAGQLVEFIKEENLNQKAFRVRTLFGKHGYVAHSTLSPLLGREMEKAEISLAVKSHIGWHIVKMENTQKMRKSEYGKYLTQTELKEQKKAGQDAQYLADQYWQRLTQTQYEQFEKDLYAGYHLRKNRQKVNTDWRTQKFAFQNEKISLSSLEFMQVVKWFCQDRSLALDDILRDEDELNKLLNNQLKFMIYVPLETKLPPDVLARKQVKNNFDFSNYLTQLTQKKLWYSQIEVSETEIRSKYAEYLENMANLAKRDPTSKKTLKRFEEISKELRRRALFDKMNKIKLQQQEMLLKTHQFQFVDKHLSESYF